MPRHDLDVISLVAGVAFGGAALVYLVDQSTGLSGRWVWPILLIVLGVAGLLATPGRGGEDPVGDGGAEVRQLDRPGGTASSVEGG